MNDRWQVVVRNDDSQSALVAAYVLREMCGVEFSEAGALASEIDAKGEAQVRRFSDQAQAEHFAVGLQRRGLHGTVRPL